jgi:hypothetical protein
MAFGSSVHCSTRESSSCYGFQAEFLCHTPLLTKAQWSLWVWNRLYPFVQSHASKGLLRRIENCENKAIQKCRAHNFRATQKVWKKNLAKRSGTRSQCFLLLNNKKPSDRKGCHCKTTLRQAWLTDMARKPQCAFEMSMFMCPAVHMSTRSLLRPSSTHEPSDPPFWVVIKKILFFFNKKLSKSQFK